MFDVMLKVQITLIRDRLAGIQQVYSMSVFACDNNILNMFHFICMPLFNHCLGSIVSVIWIGQGNFLTLNSDKTTMGRNSGIFWALLQCR